MLKSEIESGVDNEWSASRIKRDEEDVQHLITAISACNLFQSDDGSGSLRNISNGTVTEHVAAKCLLNLRENGEKMVENFEKERLNLKEKNIFDRIPRVPFHNFDFRPNKINVSSSSKACQDSQDAARVQQAFMIASLREFDHKLLASYELLETPKYLFDNDGRYRKSPKSVLASEIESKHDCRNDEVEVLSCDTQKIYVLDGMAIVHQIQLKRFATFGEFAHAFYKRITALYSRETKRVDIVFDRYDDVSIKFTESRLRSKGRSPSLVNISSQATKVPSSCNDFFVSPENKFQLVKFLCKSAPLLAKIRKDSELYICGGFDDPSRCYKLRGSTFTEVLDLKSDQLEADSRMFNHVFHAAENTDHNPNYDVIILSPDTDVFILGIYHWNELSTFNIKGL